MILNDHTKTRDVLPLLTEERLTDVLDKVKAVRLKTPVTSMTIAEFAAVTDGELPSEILRERRALRCLGKIRQLRDELKAIGDYIVDFYCAKARLVIELDGGGHYTTEQAEKDKHRYPCLPLMREVPRRGGGRENSPSVSLFDWQLP